MYVREKDVSNNWSSAAFRTIVIDTGKPCSEAAAPSAVGAQERIFTITYTYNDIYEKEDCGAASSGSGTEKIELYVKTPRSSVYTLADTDIGASVDRCFEYTATEEGAYYFYTVATDKAGNTEDPPPSEEYDAKTVYGSQFAGYAVLAVGSIANNEGIESHTLTANIVYKHLISRGFALVNTENREDDPLDHIKYFNPYGELQPGEDFIASGMSYREALRKAFTEWAPEKMKAVPGPFYLIFIDHGSPDKLHLSGTVDIGAQELAGWLDILKSDIVAEGTDQPVVIILGTCYSGSFIDDLSGPGRIIVASASANELSYGGAKEPGGTEDGEFFISALFNALGQGNDLKTGFESAVQQTETYTYSGKDDNPDPEYKDTAMQHPLLDDNGDGKGSNNFTLTECQDGKVAENIVLGYGSDDALPPLLITNAGKHPDTPLYGTDEALLWAEMSDKERTKSVWVEIREPGMILENGDSVQIATQQTVKLVSRPLEWNDQTDRYELTYSEFSKPGTYILYFYARDDDDITSPFVREPLYRKAEGDLADAVEALKAACDDHASNENINVTDVNRDDKIGLAEAIYFLRKAAGL
ncbi:C13 family peptidase [Desulfococcaceae bacterium HSG8]|nr:C13 family peptidase [Desulfococcaceae bacterium HSG8]